MASKTGSRIYVGTPEETPIDVVSRVTDYLARKFPNQSPAEALAGLPTDERAAWLASLTPSEQAQLEYTWDFWARPNQREPKTPYKVLILMAGRGYGKDLRNSTPIATPRGWKTMGSLSVGDVVFDENGIQTRVTGIYPQGLKQMYRLKFSDSTFIDAGAEHLWVTWQHRDRKAFLRSRYEKDKTKFPRDWVNWKSNSSIGPEVRTTLDIANTLTHSKRADTNHCIPLAGALYTPQYEIPIDYYLLGYWLGDGHSNDQAVTVGDEDLDWVIDAFSAQYAIELKAPENRSWMVRCPGMAQHLRSLGIFGKGAKRIPEKCLRASYAQRLALLQGLMDSDGSADNDGSSVEFCNKNADLSNGVVELARSLGQKPVLNTGWASLYGKDCGERYRVTWKPTIDVFRLPRKRDCIHFDGAQALRNHHRMIEAVEKIDTDESTCITVDSPNAMFLAGEGMIPTHNTRTAAEIVRGWIESGKRKHIALVGANAADVRDTMVEAVYKQGSGLMQICPPWNRPHYSPTKKTLVWNNPNYPSYGAVCSLYSAEEPDGLRGPSHDGAWIDEWAKQKFGDSVWHMLKFTLRRGDNPQTIISTTPKPVTFLIDMLKEAQESKEDGTNDVIVVKGSTYENRANLSSSFITDINQMYEGTTLGRQEIYADLVLDAEGALWNMAMIDASRLRMNREGVISIPSLERIVIAVDPQTGYKIDTEKSKTANGRTMTGIVAAGASMHVRGQPPHAYILGDYSMNGKPEDWAKEVIRAYRLHDAQEIVAEQNQGGQMIASVIRTVDPHVRIKLVTATIKKHERAIPVVAKYQQCVAGDTLIVTSRGEIPIRDVKYGDYVYTRRGLRKVLWSGITGTKKTVKVCFGDKTLICTPKHEIFSNKRFTHAEQLADTYGILLLWQEKGFLRVVVGKLLRERAIAVIHAVLAVCGQRESQLDRIERLKEYVIMKTKKATGDPHGAVIETAGNYYTEKYGNISMVRYPTVMISITKIQTKEIIPSRISFHYGLQTIKHAMSAIRILTKSWQESGRRNLSGGRPEKPLQEYVSGVMDRSIPKQQESDSVHRNVTRAIGMITVKEHEIMPVYNLHVEDDHEFFADGILVHNCRVHHVGVMAELEQEMVLYEPGDEENKRSPNRMDALVWGVRYLLVDGQRAGAGISIGRRI